MLRREEVHLVRPWTCQTLLVSRVVRIGFVLLLPAVGGLTTAVCCPSFIIIGASVFSSTLVFVRGTGTEAAVAARNSGRRRIGKRIVRRV